MYQDLPEHEDLIAAYPAVAALATGGDIVGLLLR
jgi:hypothetical protein